MSKKNQEIEEEQSEVLEDVIASDNEPVELNLTDLSEKVEGLNDSTLIKVKSNVFGKLVYVNKKSGERIVWERCGEIQTLTLGDLRTMKASSVKFFSAQWVVILGAEETENTNAKPADIYKTLGITKFYKDFIEPSNYRVICNWTEKEIKEKVSLLNKNARQNLIIALNEYISKGILDSKRKIKAFEEALGCNLEEGGDL